MEDLSSIDSIKELLDNADKQIVTQLENRVIILGNTGSGKTTLLNFLLDLPLFSKEEGGKRVIDVELGSGFKIEHRNLTCTTIPNEARFNDYNFADCPGFEDTRSVSQEIFNAYCIKKIFTLSRKVKIVLVLESGIEKACRGNNLISIFSQLVELIHNTDALFSSLTIVITKCNIDFEIENFLESLQDIANHNNRAGQEVKRILLGLSSFPNKISRFYKPGRDDNIDKSKRAAIFEAIESIQYSELRVNLTLSNLGKIKIQELSQKTEIELIENLKKIAEKLFANFNKKTDLKLIEQAKFLLNEINRLDSGSGNSKNKLEKFMLIFKDEPVQNLIFRLIFCQDYYSQTFNFSNLVEPFKQVSLRIDQTLKDRELSKIEKKKVLELKSRNKSLELSNAGLVAVGAVTVVGVPALASGGVLKIAENWISKIRTAAIKAKAEVAMRA